MQSKIENNNTGRHFAKDILSYQSSYANHRKDYIEATKLSNHDEQRTSFVLGSNVAKCKQAGAVLLTAQGHPYIYAGEELALNPKTSKDKGDEYIRGGSKFISFTFAQKSFRYESSVKGLAGKYLGKAFAISLEFSIFAKNIKPKYGKGNYKCSWKGYSRYYCKSLYLFIKVQCKCE